MNSEHTAGISVGCCPISAAGLLRSEIHLQDPVYRAVYVYDDETRRHAHARCKHLFRGFSWHAHITLDCLRLLQREMRRQRHWFKCQYLQIRHHCLGPELTYLHSADSEVRYSSGNLLSVSNPAIDAEEVLHTYPPVGCGCVSTWVDWTKAPILIGSEAGPKYDSYE